MTFKSIIIFMRPGEATVVGSWVLKDVQEFADDNNIVTKFYTDGEDLSKYVDALYISIGGDGTMLRTLDLSIQTNIANDTNTTVVGFNAGTVGFLTEEPSRYEPKWLLEQILNDSSAVRLEERLALSTTINGRNHYALNEFAFTPRNIAAPLTYQISINGNFVAEHMGSGCLVATPTGSTAMSMSAGGAIIVPSADVMQVVPIIPHTLSSRPVITTGTDEITVTSDLERVDEVIISSDGREFTSFVSDAKITVKKAPQPVRVWYASRRDFFSVLSDKLDW